MIKKFKYMVKGVNNPFTQIVVDALGLEWRRDKGNPLVTNKTYTISELDNFVNCANAAWEAACEYRLKSEASIEFEVSTVIQESVGHRAVNRYVQLKFKGRMYRIYIPEGATYTYEFKNAFGDFYRLGDISDIVANWIRGDYTGQLLPNPQTQEEEEEETLITQETDLFVLFQRYVYSVDTGYGGICFTEPVNVPYIFVYPRCDYSPESTYTNLSVEKYEGEVLVCETAETGGFFNVVNMEFCKLEEIGMAWLKKLERMYREGRSSLPDAMFDSIMDHLKVSEERLQALCGSNKLAKHYNSVGVDTAESGEICKNYPAQSKILSQAKVRNVSELVSIVYGWNGKAVVSWKLDGVAVRLHYHGRNLVRAESKGKSRDVTDLIRLVASVPQRIKCGRPFSEEGFENAEWFVTGELVAVDDRRSVAAGFLLRKDVGSDKTLAIARRLTFVAYDTDVHKFKSESQYVAPIRLYSQALNLLEKEGGFNVVGLCEFRGAEQFADVFDDIKRPDGIDTDGLVVRVNDINKYASLGETSHHPKGSVAFKFEDYWYTVTPKMILGKRGKNNVLKLIAKFSPIEIDGKSVESAVWQPRDTEPFVMVYNPEYYAMDNYARYNEVRVRNLNTGKLEAFKPGEIEVCLRGRVIPQWRLKRD